jgi:hypothetical protein
VGWIKNATGGYSLALLIIGIGLAISGLIALALRDTVAHERPGAEKIPLEPGESDSRPI